MILTVETAWNGYIVRVPPEDEGMAEGVFLCASEDPAEATRLMLVEVLEQIGHMGSRYDERRVQIVLAHGDKWEPPDEQDEALGADDAER